MADPSPDRADDTKANVCEALKPQAAADSASPRADDAAAAAPNADAAAAAPPTPPPAADDSDGRNLYVDNLALSSDVELRNLFLPYGPILKSRLAIDPTTRQPAGYGFVMFERREDALKAIDGLNQHVLGTKRLRVSVKRSKLPLTAQQQQQSGRSSADGAAEALPSSLSSLPARPAAAAVSPSLSSSSSLSAAPSASSPQSLSVSSPAASSASPPALSSAASSSTNLYISGLPASWRQSDVESLFGPFGRISDSRLLLDRLTGQPRGVAMLRFESASSAQEAIAALHRSYTPPNMQQTIAVKYATDKPAQLQQPTHRPSPATPLSSPNLAAHLAISSLTSGSAARLHRSSLPPAAVSPSPSLGASSLSSPSVHSPSSPPRTRLSASLSSTLRGSPLIRLLPPSESSVQPHDGELSGLPNGVSPSRSASSLSSLSASPPPSIPLNDTASTDSTASNRTSSLSPAVSQSSSPPSAARRTPNGGNSASNAYHTPTRSSAAGKQLASSTTQSHSPHSAQRHMNGSYSAVQQQPGRPTNHSPLPASPPPPFVVQPQHLHHQHHHQQQLHHPHHQHPHIAAYTASSSAAAHAAQQSHSMAQQAAGGMGQTNRYSSVGLAASEHTATKDNAQCAQPSHSHSPHSTICSLTRSPALYTAPLLSHPYLSLAAAAHPAASGSLYHPTFASPLLALPGVQTANAALYTSPAHPHSLAAAPHHQQHHSQHQHHSYAVAPSLLSSGPPSRTSIGASLHHAALIAASSAHPHAHLPAATAQSMAGLGAGLALGLTMQPFAEADSGAAGGLSSSLYAYGLPSALTDSDLHELFGIYGGVSSVHIMRNDNGTPKGYAFINMKSVQDAAVAQLYLDHFPMGGRTLRVQFKRQHNHNAQHSSGQQPAKLKGHTPNAASNATATAQQQQQHYSQHGTETGSDSGSNSHTG